MKKAILIICLLLSAGLLVSFGVSVQKNYGDYDYEIISSNSMRDLEQAVNNSLRNGGYKCAGGFVIETDEYGGKMYHQVLVQPK